MLLALLIVTILLHSCQKDLFNAELVKATYQDKFPVKDIDPLMNWKTTRPVQVDIDVYEDEGTVYTIRIFDDNPQTDSESVHLLAEGTAGNGLAFQTTIDCPNATDTLFVAKIDTHNRVSLRCVPVKANCICTTFGSRNIQTRSALTRSFVTTPTRTPRYTEAEILAKAAKAQELHSSSVLRNSDIYKISEGTQYKSKITTSNIQSSTPAILIIEGSWEPKGNNLNVASGVEIYVTSTGNITIPNKKALSMQGYTHFTVYPGGKISGGNISINKAEAGCSNYNAGTLNVDNISITQSGEIYNCGQATIGTLTMTTGNGTFINQGQAYITTATGDDCQIENGCYMEIGTFDGTLKNGDNCAAKINQLTSRGGHNDITLGENSMLTIQSADLRRAVFTGSPHVYSLCQINRIAYTNSFTTSGCIYYGINQYDKNNRFFLEPFTGDTLFGRPEDAPVILPAGECTGEGHIPTEEGGGAIGKPMTYTYVFEDNYPLVGDYDFNDLVLDVSLQYDKERNQVRGIRIGVQLTAVGASKEIGAGLRIIGLKATDIAEIRGYGNGAAPYLSTLSKSFFISGYSQLTTGNNVYYQPDGNNIVIPLFGDAHKAIANVSTISGREFYNTKKDGKRIEPKEYQIEIVLKESARSTVPPVTKEQLDFFIGYRYRMMEPRMEVHLYEFWSYQPTPGGTMLSDTNLDLAGNNTWAICVPNFRYPIEWCNISNQSDITDCAYPYFLDWARDRNSYQSWYLYPNEENVYR